MRYEFGTEGMSRSGRLCSLATLVERQEISARKRRPFDKRQGFSVFVW